MGEEVKEVIKNREHEEGQDEQLRSEADKIGVTLSHFVCLYRFCL